MTKISQTIKLNNGLNLPRLGLGVWKIDNTKVGQAVAWALAAGYRHLDTACAYHNEAGVGEAVGQSGIKRNQVFITTKLAINDFFRPQAAFNESLNRLQMNYVDLYLLHWPFLNWKNAWTALEKIYRQGQAKSIGVSNFGISQLEYIKKHHGLKPVVNQIELSPFLYRQQLINYCQSEGIIVEAYSPLTRGKRLSDPTISSLAVAYHKTPAQIMIHWGLQHDFVMIPKSENRRHLQENIDVFDFDIDPQDMKKLDALNENYSALFPGWTRK